MKIFAITFGGPKTPSTRYRLLNYAPLHQAAGDSMETVRRRDLRFSHLRSCRENDVVINQKCLLPIPWGWMIRACAKRLVFEFDDALWLRQGKPYNWLTQQRVNARLRWWLKNSDAITCTNEYLASYARRFNKNVKIIPTGIDLPVGVPNSKDLPADGSFILGWSGSSSSIRYLNNCEETLAIFLEKYPNAKLRVLCDHKPNLKFPFEFEKWSPEVEAPFFSGLTVGLLPLDMSDEFALGKYPVKALSTMAYAVPVVGNMTSGGAAEIAKNGGCIVANSPADWLTALESLLDNKTYVRYSLAALSNVRLNHDMRRIFDLWRTVLKP